MRTPSIDSENIFKTLNVGLVIAATGLSSWFSLSGDYQKSIFYLTGAVLMNQFLIIHYVTKGNRMSIASSNLLEKKLPKNDAEQGEEDDEKSLEEHTEDSEE